MATVELIQNNAKDLGDLQRKLDSWHAQGLDEREIMARSKDEQLRSKGNTFFKYILKFEFPSKATFTDKISIIFCDGKCFISS